MEVDLTVWVCPTNGCGNYYAASSAGDLRTTMNVEPNSSKTTFPRSRCPDCKTRGREVDRVPVGVIATLCAIIALFCASFAAPVQAKPNANPPSVVPGKTNCASVNCKRRRVWKKRFFELPYSDRQWVRSTGACETRGMSFYTSFRANTGNGYYGRLQFSWITARRAGFTLYPNRVWRYEQEVRGVRWMHSHGKGQWPICGT